MEVTLLANIKLSWKDLSLTNAVAYLALLKVMKKMFIKAAPYMSAHYTAYQIRMDSTGQGYKNYECNLQL